MMMPATTQAMITKGIVWIIDILLAVGAALVHLPIKEKMLVKPAAA